MKGKRYLDTKNSQAAAITGSSGTIATALVAGKPYVFAANTDCWIHQDTGVVAATKASGSTFVPKGTLVDLHGSDGDTVTAIDDTATGTGCVTPVHEI